MWPRMQIPDLPLLRFYTYACSVPVWFLFDLPRPERPTSKRQPQSCFISLSAKQWKKGLFLPEQTTTELYFLWPCTGLTWSSNGKDTSEGRGSTNYACYPWGTEMKEEYIFVPWEYRKPHPNDSDLGTVLEDHICPWMELFPGAEFLQKRMWGCLVGMVAGRLQHWGALGCFQEGLQGPCWLFSIAVGV